MTSEEQIELEQKIQGLLQEACSDLARCSSVAFVQQIEVVWNKRMRSTAGRAFLHLNRIELNPRLMQFDFSELRNTLYHEFAHMLVEFRYPRKKVQPHGAEWRQACVDLGIPDEKRTHELPLPKRTMRKHWSYTCPRCEKVIYRVRRMKNSFACAPCCKALNHGKFDKRFQFIEHRLQYP